MAHSADPIAHRLAAAWAVGIAVLLLVPLPVPSHPPEWVPEILDLTADKIAHAALFFGGTRAFLRSARARDFERPALAAALIAIAYGGALEVLQGLVGRDASLGDLTADALGAALAASPLPSWRRAPQ
jgi:VanZ family protein